MTKAHKWSNGVITVRRSACAKTACSGLDRFGGH